MKKLVLMVLTTFFMGGVGLAQNRADLIKSYEKLLKKGKNADAVVAIQKVIDAGDNYDDLYVHYINLGLAQSNLEEYQKALTSFDVANQLRPNLVFVLKRRGEMRFYLKDYNGTIEDYTRLIENDPTDEESLLVRSNAYMMIKDTAASLQDLHTILSVNPESVSAQNNVADIQMARGELQEAMAVFQQLLKKHPEQAILYENVGEVYYKMHNNEQAMVYFLKAQKIDPRYVTPYISIGKIQMDSGDYSGALKNFEKAKEYKNYHDDLPALIERCRQKLNATSL